MTANLAAGRPDPVFAAIQRHQDLTAHFDAAIEISGGMTDDPEFEDAEAVTNERGDALVAHADVLICKEPTTLAGIVVLLRYVARLEEWQTPSYWKRWEAADGVVMDWRQTFLDTMAKAIEAIARQAAGGAA